MSESHSIGPAKTRKWASLRNPFTFRVALLLKDKTSEFDEPTISSFLDEPRYATNQFDELANWIVTR